MFSQECFSTALASRASSTGTFNSPYIRFIVPRVTDQEHHPTLRQGLHDQAGPHRAAGLLDRQVSAVQLRETRVGPVQDEVPDGTKPDVFVLGREDEMLPTVALEPLGVEDGSDPGLEPHVMTFWLLHHRGEPGAPGTSRAEDPDHVLGSHTTGGAPVVAGPFYQGTAGNAGLEAKGGPDPARHTGDLRMSEDGHQEPPTRCSGQGRAL